jgi:prophage regulatory protein
MKLPTIPKEKVLLSRADLKKMGIEKSNTTLLRSEVAGRFPKRVRLNGCSVAWLRSDIELWLENISKARAHHVYGDLH